MLDPIYHMKSKLLKKRLFAQKSQDFAIFYKTLKWTQLRNVITSVNH